MAVCLVTGGAGFLGSHLVEELVKRGDAVRVLDDLSTGRLEYLEPVSDEVDFVLGDISDEDLVRQAVKGVDYLFHLVGRGGTPRRPSAATEEPIFAAAHAACVRRLVFASGLAVYGSHSTAPYHEAQPPQPATAHALAEWAAEQACIAFNEASGLETVRLRYSSVFGPRQSPASPYTWDLQSITRAMLRGRRPVLFGAGTGGRDFIHVDDAVHATLLAADAPRLGGRVYNIGRGRPASLLDVVAVLNGILGTQLRPIHIYDSSPEAGGAASVLRAETDLGFCPFLGLEDGLKRWVEQCTTETGALVQHA
jgi:UDP-glucose 4-epimerase